MGSMSPIHWIIVVVIVLVLFGGGGKISSLMGDFAKGIKSFKKGLSEDDDKAIGADRNLAEDGSVKMSQEPAESVKRDDTAR